MRFYLFSRSGAFGAIVATATGLTACGGGGDGPAVPGTFAARQAYANVLGTDLGVTVAGRGSDGLDYSLEVNLVTAPAAAYPGNGVVGLRSQQTTTLFRGAVPDPPTTTVVYYEPTTPSVIGQTSSSGGCATVTSAFAIPDETPVDTSGALFDADSFVSCGAGAPFTGTVLSDWSVEYEAFSGIVFFCVTGTQRNGAGVATASESDCLEIARNGAIGARARVTVVLAAGTASAPNGFTLVARNY